MNQNNNYTPWNPNFSPPPPPRDNSGFAVASFVVGLVGLLLNFCCIPYISFIMGILALIFGLVSLRSAKKGLGIAGVILGVVSILLWLLITTGLFSLLGFGGGLGSFLEQFLYELTGEYIRL